MVLRSRLSRLALVLLPLFCSPRILAADNPKPETAVREEARVTVVEVPVNVIDKKGHPVEGLKAEDFEVYDDGKKQTISGFDVVDERRSVPKPEAGEFPVNPAARRNFLVLFDLSFSSPRGIVNARRSARDFVVNRMKDLDHAAVATYSVETGMRLLVNFTDDRTQLASAIDTLGFPTLSDRNPDPLSMLITPLSQSNSSGFAYLPGASVNSRVSDLVLQDTLENMQIGRDQALHAIYRDRVNRLLDSFANLARALDSVKGRKHILFLSEGFDSRELTGSTSQGGGSVEGEWVLNGQAWKVDSDTRFGNTQLQSSMAKALALFNRSDCVIHAIDIAGLRALSDPSGNSEQTLNGQESLFFMANETGGEFLKNSNDLSNSFDQLLERTGLMYVLAFQLVRVPENGKFHSLKVKVKDTSYKISARSGYYEPKSYSMLSSVEKKLAASSALAAAQPRTDIPTWVLSSPFPAADGMSHVPIIVEVPGDRLLAKQESSQMNVDLFLYAVDQQHQTKDYLFHTLQFDLTKVRERLQKAGVKYYGEMNLPPGQYTLRVLVRNNDTGRFGVSVTPLIVPESQDAFTSPPLFMEGGADWVMVRGKSRAADQESGYPFAISGQPFVPEASPNVKSGDQTVICLMAYNFADESSDIQYTGRILGEDGRAHGRAELKLVKASDQEPEGARKFVLQFTPRGLNPGRYALAVKLQDAKNGKTSENSFPFDVQ